jgi:hypothetical protein
MRILKSQTEYIPPLCDWLVLLRPGWGAELPHNIYGRVMGVAWLRLKATGLCGMVAPDGSDVWDRANVTKRH